MGLGYEYFIQIKTVIADSHYIYIFFFFSNLFISYYYYSRFSCCCWCFFFLFFVYGCMGCFGFPHKHNISMMNNVFMCGTQSQKENPFCKSLRKKNSISEHRKTITRITGWAFSFPFWYISIYLSSVEPNYFIFP